jgi:DNA mismatch endonuclease, patch repair protein
MAEKISVFRRSVNMAAIQSGDTKPEMIVRRLVYRLGYRYRLHRRDLPGKPDLVFGPRRAAIFVHGCFWHMHPKGCPDAREPKSNTGYWQPKLRRNVERDKENIRALRRDGWSVLVIWDCETKDAVQLTRRLITFLGPTLSNSVN